MATDILVGAMALLTVLLGELREGLRTGVSTGTHATVQFVGEPPADVACGFYEARASGGTFDVLGLNAPVGSADGYLLLRVCASPSDGGTMPTPPGLDVLPTARTTPYVAGMPQLDVWRLSPTAPFTCACAAGPACQWTPKRGVSGTAPTGLTLNAGTWAGSDCHPKPCMEFYGHSSMPAACDTWAADAGAP
jgi:hypothetical protein